MLRFMLALPIPMVDAVRRSEAAGVSARVLVGVKPDVTELVVALRSTDAESTLHLIYRPPFGPNEIPLERRTQSGPERWDYPIALPTTRERYVLRLERAGKYRDVPLLSAVQAIVRTHGWTDDAALLGEPVLSAADLERAIAELSTDTSTG